MTSSPEKQQAMMDDFSMVLKEAETVRHHKTVSVTDQNAGAVIDKLAVPTLDKVNYDPTLM